MQAQSQLISNSGELINDLRDFHQRPTSKFVASQISTEFPSDLLPQYESATFKIKNYTTLRDTREVIFSDPLIANGLTWRLKVYPNGNGIAKNNYISIFIEMVNGLLEPSKYEYRVEMKNLVYPNKEVTREFSSDFELNECWGYNRFYRIDVLE